MSNKNPKRPFRDRPRPAERVDRMRKSQESTTNSRPSRLQLPDGRVFEAVDPLATCRLALPDGSVVETTGADLIAAAEATIALQDAIDRDEPPAVLKAAFDRLDATM
jgi:hypothetical protein